MTGLAVRGRWACVAMAMAMALGGCDSDPGPGMGSGDGETGSSVHPCLEEFGPGPDTNWESDDAGSVCVDPNGCDPITPEDIEAECEQDMGTLCQPASYMTRQAALCFAEEHGLAEGLEPWTADLVYNYQYKTPIWAVMNVTVDDPADCLRMGEVLMMRAFGGAIAGEFIWSEQC